MSEMNSSAAGRIVRLEVDNIKRLKAVRVTPEGSLVIVSGENDQGKSSVLDAIKFALGGPTALKGEVKRHGSIAGRVLVELEGLTVTRTIMDGKQAVVVESKTNGKVAAPQMVLNKLMTALTFDPLAFAHLDAKAQRKVLIGLVDLGFDPDDVAAQIKGEYDRRTVVGREVTKLEGTIATAPEVPDDTPAEPVASADLMAELESALQGNNNRATWENRVSDRRARVEQAELAVKDAQIFLDRQRDELYSEEKMLDAAPARVDTAALRERVGNVDAINAHVRTAKTLAALRVDLTDQKAVQAAHTAEIARLTSMLTDGLAAAVMPIEGLTFDDDGVMFNGFALEGTSESSRVKVSAAIQMALNPDLRVMLIDNGNALDKANMLVLSEMAEANDYQIWMTWVGENSASQLVIVDGEEAPE